MTNPLDNIVLDEDTITTQRHIDALFKLVEYKLDMSLVVGHQKTIAIQKMKEAFFWVTEGLKENQAYRLAVQALEKSKTEELKP